MSGPPDFDDRPNFEFSNFSAEVYQSDLEPLIRSVVRRYDSFLDEELLPAQGEYADILDRFEGWKLRFDSEHVEELMEKFREFPCMNDPTEGVMEVIPRREGYYPAFLSVLADADSCANMAGNTNLSRLGGDYRFVDEDGNERMLAYDVMPYEDDFSNWEVLHKYEELRCGVTSVQQLRKCIVIPKTNLFRHEGGPFWSRRYFGKFDVVALSRANL
ncbi:hypothetical protein QFZ94_006675 [Paraburkholderia sp. JPY465]|uniref:RolB family protein n=1 Tax=Paraburkholderia sp. JPY465 TaxID=3042285 RepID=UPI003D1A5084